MLTDGASTQTALVAALSATGGASAVAVAVFFLKDFFATTKHDLRNLTNSVNKLSESVVGLTHELQTTTRDMRKLEGVTEAQQKQLSDTTREISTLIANIKALWAALSRIHPEAIPKRLSDSGAPHR